MADIISLMEELGFPTNKEGVCEGLAWMAEKARSREMYDEFKSRMEYLAGLQQGVIKTLVEKAENHARALKLTPKHTSPLTPEEKILLTVKAYFFQVYAYFRPSAIQEFLELKGPHINQLDKIKIEEMMYDEEAVSEKENIKLRSPTPHHYLLSTSATEGHQYLNSFLEKIQKSKSSIGLVISSLTHSVHLFYDNEKGYWQLTNHSKLETHFSLNDKLLKSLVEAFTTNDIVHLNFRVLTQENPESLFEKLAEISNESIEKSSSNDVNFKDESLFFTAVHYGYVTIVKPLLKNPAINVNAVNMNGMTPLLLAAYHSDHNMIKALLEHTAVDVNKAHQNGSTPLLIAAENGHDNAVKVLLDSNHLININQADNYGNTPLSIAAQNGHVGVVDTLLTHLKNSAIPVDQSLMINLLFKAAKNGHEAMIEFLLEHSKININQINDDNNTPLSIAVQNGHVRVVDALLTHLKNSAIPVDQSLMINLLFKAAKNGHVAMLEFLLEHSKININQINDDGNTLLFIAIQEGHDTLVNRVLSDPDIEINPAVMLRLLSEANTKGHTAVVKTLLNHPKIDINQTDAAGNTLLLMATQKGDDALVNHLLDHQKIKINPTTMPGLIFEAIKNGRGSVFNAFLKHPKVNVNQADDNGNTILFLIAQKGPIIAVNKLLNHPDIQINPVVIFKLLLEAIENNRIPVVDAILKHPKIDVNQVDANGSTLLFMAAAAGHTNMVKRLLIHPDIDINKMTNGVTPLFIAVKNRQENDDIVNKLLDHPNIDVNQMSNGVTPLMMAAELGHAAIVEKLLHRSHTNSDVVFKLLFEAAERDDNNLVKIFLNHAGTHINQVDDDNVLLFIAAQNDRIALVDKLLSRTKTNPDILFKLSVEAIEKGQADLLEVLLKHSSGIDINQTDNHGNTLLSIAIQKDRAALVDKLLNRDGININLGNNNGNTPLLIAAQKNEASLVDKLLNRADINPDIMLKLLFEAIEKGRVDLIKVLLKHSEMMINQADNNGNTPLLIAVKNYRYDDRVVKTLLDNSKIDVNQIDNDGHTPLLIAAQCGYENVVKALLSPTPEYRNIDINKAGKNGETPLFLAVKNGHYGVMKELLTYPNIDINAKNNGGDTILFAATRLGRDNMVRALLNSALKNLNVDVNQTDKFGDTPLLCAIRNRRDHVAEVLLHPDFNDLKIDVNNTDASGNTPLFMAIQHDNDDLVDMLLEHPKIDVNKVCHGVTPLLMAIEENHATAISALLDHEKIDVNQAGENEFTPLFTAILNEDVPLVKMLLNHKGINLNISIPIENDMLIQTLEETDRETESLSKLIADKSLEFLPFHMAVFGGNEEIVKIFLEKGVDIDALAAKDVDALALAKASEHDDIGRLIIAHKENQEKSNKNIGPTHGHGLFDHKSHTHQKTKEITPKTDPSLKSH